MIYSPTSSPIEVATRSPINDRSALSSGGGSPPPPATYYMLDNSGNILTDQAGNRLTFQ